jgi:hypothetical protein
VTGVQNRVFVVGCPRSGTTLIQSLLNGHPDIHSFPETHAFIDVSPPLPWARYGLVQRGSIDRIGDFLEDIDRPDLKEKLPRIAVTWGRMARGLVRVLDTMATEAGASAWVEKTPDHLNHVDRLETHVPEARIIHVLRNGPDVVASLRTVTQRHPRAWGRDRSWSLKECAEKWVRAVRASRSRADGDVHLLVRYEDVVADPESVFEEMVDHIGLPWEPSAVERRSEAAGTLVRENEPWKADVGEAIENRNGERFYNALDPRERERVMDLLEGTEVEDLVVRPPRPRRDQSTASP